MYTNIISSISNNNACSIIDVEYHKVIQQISINKQLTDSSWTNDGFVSYSCNHNSIVLWDTRTDNVMNVKSLHNSYKHTFIQNIENSETFITCGYSDGYSELGFIDVRYPEYSQKIKLECTSSLHSFIFDPDLKLIFYSVKGTNTIRAYYIKVGFELSECQYIYSPKRISSLQYLPRLNCDFKNGDITMLLLRCDDVVYPFHIRASINDESIINEEQNHSFEDENNSNYIEYYDAFFGKFSSKEPQLSNSLYLSHQKPERNYYVQSVNGLFSIEMEKYFLNKEFSDLTIITSDNVHIPVHKAILSVRSRYWKEILDVNKDSTYKLENINSNLFTKILYYIYTDILETSSYEEYNDMLDIASIFNLYDCCDIIKSRLRLKVKKCKSTYLNDIENLYKNPEEYYSDLKLISNGYAIHCHSIIVVEKSSFFQKGLQFKEGITKEFNFDSIDEESLRKVVHYFYTRKIELSPSDAIKIWRFSNQLCLDHLTKLCENFIINNLDNDTVIPVYLEAKKLSSLVQYYALNFIIKRIKNVKGLKNLSEDDLDKIKAYLPINVNIY